MQGPDRVLAEHTGNKFCYSRKRLNQLLDTYLPKNGKGLRLLDVGCGTGYHLSRYKDRGFDIVGVDGSEEMLKEARQANPEIEFRQCDVDTVPFENDSFDIILCVEVFRYLPDITPTVREMSRVLKSNGVALVTASPVFQANLYPIVNRFVTAAKIDRLTQLKQYFHTSGKLRNEFRGAGFADVEVHGVYGGAINWVERIAPSIVPGVLKGWEKIDDKIADAPVLKNFSNMFLIYAERL